jgi:ergothioneine biosynthesis protein EgtB
MIFVNLSRRAASYRFETVNPDLNRRASARDFVQPQELPRNLKPIRSYTLKGSGRSAMSTFTPNSVQTSLADRFRSVRRRTLALTATLTPEDMMVQSCPEASPVKWHLAHTSWFFESFILREFLRGYRVFNPDFAWLFNSYYQSFSAFPEKRLRSSFSRPGLEEVLRFRAHVDESIERLLEHDVEPEALQRIELGVNHEEQHQELVLTDMLHAFYTNPLRPVYAADTLPKERISRLGSMRFLRFEGGMQEAGHAGEGFCFDNELPRHRVWLEPYSLAERLVTCGEYAEFMADGGYRRPEFWLSDGWNAVNTHRWRAPLYWSSESGDWTLFTLRGEQPLDRMASSPVSQVSYYEADAYARWAGRRLATELEWEVAAEGHLVAGNLLDSGRLMPAPPAELVDKQASTQTASEAAPLFAAPAHTFECPAQLFGDCWEWTASAYLGYPGFRPLAGSLGEYNGKFMNGQFILRGGSCVTPAAHIRASYRNYFSPETRWQFSGIRLAS